MIGMGYDAKMEHAQTQDVAKLETDHRDAILGGDVMRSQQMAVHH
jgi:hypothetical protein